MKDKEISLNIIPSSMETMDNSHEPTKNPEGNARKSYGVWGGAKAIRISLIGVAISFLLGLGAVSTLFTEKTDSAGLEFYIFGFLDLSVLEISIVIAAIARFIEIVKSIAITFQSNDSKDETQ